MHWTPAKHNHDSEITKNLGDRVIRDSVIKELTGILPDQPFFEISTHAYLSEDQIARAAEASVVVVGGSNLLSSHMFPTPLQKPIAGIYRQWKVRSRQERLRELKIVLMACGWWKYQNAPDFFTKKLLKHLLTGNGMLHSVRDSYTERMLRSSGIDTVINTGCSTMWNLHGISDADSPSLKQDTALCTLTDYSKDPAGDRAWLETVRSQYSRVVFWPQGAKDMAYFKKLSLDGTDILDGDDQAFSNALKTWKVDYIGTRLHAGIRAIQSQRDALIIGIDNRAKEISRDTGLRTIDKEDLDSLTKWISGERQFRITMPVDEIKRWKEALTQKITNS